MKRDRDRSRWGERDGKQGGERDRDRSRWGEKDGKREERGESEIGHDEGKGGLISHAQK